MYICIIVHSLYPLQQLRRFEADVEPVGRLAVQLHRLQLSEPGGCFHLAEDWTGARFLPEGQGHAKMSIGPHLAAIQIPHNSCPESFRVSVPRNEKKKKVSSGHVCSKRTVSPAVPRDDVLSDAPVRIISEPQEEETVQPAPRASRRSLIRRTTEFDVCNAGRLGFPPFSRVPARIFIGRSASVKLLAMINDGAWSFVREDTETFYAQDDALACI